MSGEFDTIPRGDLHRQEQNQRVQQKREEGLQSEERSRLDRVGKLEREEDDQEGRRERGVLNPQNGCRR